jgi:hypothetical protein
MVAHRIFFHERLVLLDCHLFGCKSETAGDEAMVEKLVGFSLGFCRRRAHVVLHRSFDHGVRLPLAVYEPATVSLVSRLHQFGISVLKLLLLTPSPQSPSCCSVNACVGIFAVEVEQLADKGRSFI